MNCTATVIKTFTGRGYSFSSLLRWEMGKEKRIEPELAKTLGGTVTPRSIRETPLNKELKDIPDIASQ